MKNSYYVYIWIRAARAGERILFPTSMPSPLVVPVRKNARAPQTNGRHRVIDRRRVRSDPQGGRESHPNGSSRTTDLGTAEAEETRSAGESTFTTAMLHRSAQLTAVPCSLERSNESGYGSHITHVLLLKTHIRDRFEPCFS